MPIPFSTTFGTLSDIAIGLIIGLILFALLPTPVQAAGEPVDFVLGGEGANSWGIDNIKPSDSGIKTVELHNAGSATGAITIWITDIEEIDDTVDGAILDDYLIFDLSHGRLDTNMDFPAKIYDFPQNASDANYITILSLDPGETITLDWLWEFSETGEPQNDAQGDSLSFTINYMLEELPSENRTVGVGVPTYGLELDLFGVTRTLRVRFDDDTLFRSYVISDPESGYSLVLNRGTRVICYNKCFSCNAVVPAEITAGPLYESLYLPYGQMLVSPVCNFASYCAKDNIIENP